MVDETDAVLVALVRRGDRAAAERLARRYLGACRAVALSIVREVAGAEDVCQDAFVYAMEHIDDCREPARFGGWLITIVRHRSLNQVRDSKHDRQVDLEVAEPWSQAASPERNAERAEIQERILAALSALPDERRSVLLLHDLEGFTHREIAELLGLPAGTVRSHLHHARKRLRPLLESLREREE